MQVYDREVKPSQNSLDVSAIGIVFLRANHADAAVLTCYSIPTG